MDKKEKFREVYEGKSRDTLLKEGKEYLESNLKIKSKKQVKLFWIVAAIIGVTVIWLTIVGIFYILELTKNAADKFENSRNKTVEKYSD